MRRTSTSLIVIAASVIALLLAGTSGALAHAPRGAVHQDFPPRPGATPIVIGLPNLNPPTATAVPASTHSQKPASPPDAVRVALSDARVKALLKGKAYRVQQVAPWPVGKGKLVIMNFYRPVTLSGTWLAVGKPAYHATYNKVTGLSIYVEVPRNSVAAIKPRFRST